MSLMVPGEFVKHVHQFHGFILLLLFCHPLHWVGKFLFHTTSYWVNTEQVCQKQNKKQTREGEKEKERKVSAW